VLRWPALPVVAETVSLLLPLALPLLLVVGSWCDDDLTAALEVD
jgi:hypothetical protein